MGLPVLPEAVSCHRGRVIPDPIVREMMRACGMETCPDCHRLTRVHGRTGWSER